MRETGGWIIWNRHIGPLPGRQPTRRITAFDAPLDTINNTTLRQIVRISEAGRMVRVSFSNEFGTTPLIINEAHVALRDSGSAIVERSGKQLTFSGSNSVSILPGARIISDSVDMDVANNTEVVISAYLPEDVTGSGSPVTYHVRALQTNYIAAGNQAADTDLESATTTTHGIFSPVLMLRTIGQCL